MKADEEARLEKAAEKKFNRDQNRYTFDYDDEAYEAFKLRPKEEQQALFDTMYDFWAQQDIEDKALAQAEKAAKKAAAEAEKVAALAAETTEAKEAEAEAK